MAGPVAGLVHDHPSQSLRLILGVPGAARLDTPVVSGVEWASVSPNGRLALAVREGSTLLYSYDPAFSELTETAVSGAVEPPSLAAWSLDSASAVVYSAESRSLQWVRVHSFGAYADPAIPLPAFDGAVSALAVSGAFAKAALAVENDGAYLIASSGTVQPVLPAMDLAAIALDPSGRTLWAAGRKTGELLQVTLDVDEPTTQVLFSNSEDIADITAIGLSANKRSLYLVDRASSRLLVFDLAFSGISREIALDAPVSALAPLGRSTMLLAGPRNNPDDPVYILDEAAEPSIFFVPAVREEIQ